MAANTKEKKIWPLLKKLGITQPGVLYGDDVLKLFTHAKEKQFAIPAINVTSSSNAVAVLEAARKAQSPVILQLSNSGAAFWAGKSAPNNNQQASIDGAVAAALFIRYIASEVYQVPVILHTDHCAEKILPWLDGLIEVDKVFFEKEEKPLFSSHMIDLSELSLEKNIELTAQRLKSVAHMSQWLEMEVGITGGEEDGVNNEGVENSLMYTQPATIWEIYKTLSDISPYFSIAAAFGNVHGVYHPGNVRLQPDLLGKHNAYVAEKLGADEKKPAFFVFHGGSGSSPEEFQTAISHGVVKVNLDTDTQFAYMSGTRDYFAEKLPYLQSQVGNPEGPEKPNKPYYDPRKWLREGEVTMVERVMQAFKDFGSINALLEQ